MLTPPQASSAGSSNADLDRRLAIVERAAERQASLEAALAKTQAQQHELQATMEQLLKALREKGSSTL